MSAQINHQSSSSTAAVGIDEQAKPELITTIEDEATKFTDAWVLANEDGLWTVSEDKSVRLYLRRDNDSYWPSIHHLMPDQPTCLYYCEEVRRLLVGLLNGHVFVFEVAEDYPYMRESHHFTEHTDRVSGLHLSIASEFIFSSSLDKTVLWHCSEDGSRRGQIRWDASVTSLQMDGNLLMTTDLDGILAIHQIERGCYRTLHKLSSHANRLAKSSLDSEDHILFLTTRCCEVAAYGICILENKRVFALNGHQARVVNVHSFPRMQRLFSADESGKLMIWDMSASRIVTPAWATSGNCQICAEVEPGTNCRLCGRSVCERCATTNTVYPLMGFEIRVPVCDTCRIEKILGHQHALRPLAIAFELGESIRGFHATARVAAFVCEIGIILLVGVK